jgi:DNA-binding NtrC family response regulator
MKGAPRILVVEDDAAMRDLLADELRDAGFTIVTAADGHEALEQLERHEVHAVVTDLQMPGLTGDKLLEEIRTRDVRLPVVIITAFGTIDTAVRTIKAGAFHFLPKPFPMDQLVATLEEALNRSREAGEMERLSLDDGSEGGIIAAGPAMRRVMDMVRRAASADTPVLLQGDSGTGKELVARALHGGNPARTGRFLAVNCSAIPENLIESLLFGHRRGSFTDARDDRPGLFQDAAGGTIFLDEVGDMPMSLQGKLLRVLQEKEVTPVGATTPVPVDVRVVAATHRDLAQRVKEGAFREDLFYRLNVIVVRIPPLRERAEDFLPLIAHFLRKHGERLGKPEAAVAPEAIEVMRRHAWPGNVRELENVVERALVLGRGSRIEMVDLPEALLKPADDRESLPPLQSVALVEREHILKTLRAVAGNKAAAARLLGLDRKTLYRKLKQYHIQQG